MSSLQMRESVDTDLLKTVSNNLKKERSEYEPFNHWIFDEVLDEKTVDGLLAIPFKAPTIFDHWGKRDAYNSSRIFFTPENCKANSTLKILSMSSIILMLFQNLEIWLVLIYQKENCA
jgi:hypothetical protein